jgi:hypothetical protein
VEPVSDESMADEKTPEFRSPTETLVHCLEDFGISEPKKLLVIWTDDGGDLCWSESGPSHFCENIGMLECVKAKVMEKFLK